ncbi:MAG TPA: prolyl oligopeptidase family serine peptidase, partial [Rubrobacter sp.]|nr:prolyl oligopeptidase family serine peptidase [Rubrobacter sp.]
FQPDHINNKHPSLLETPPRHLPRTGRQPQDGRGVSRVALAGATFTPDLFLCAVDIVGPSSLITLITSIPPYWKPLLATFHERVGNPDTEEDFLKSRSPLFFVDRIRIPILIAQGANDPRVIQAESEQIVAAMKEKGIDYEYLLFEDEGHGFARPENRLRFYAAAERFLAKHLGGRAEE